MKHKRTWLVTLLLAMFFMTMSYRANAAIPTESMGTLQVEPYYEKLRKAFFMGGYDEVGSCNGWVERVIHRSGLVGNFVVGGTVQELNEALSSSSKFTLVASLKGGQSDYQRATDQMIRDVNAGKIKAGDIVIYTKNMNNMSASGPHWLHAAIVMKEIFDGSVVNNSNSGAYRWKTGYIGYPTIAHALAPAWGVEYRTPMTTPSTAEADDGGSTGYYVYRINTAGGSDPAPQQPTVKSGWKKVDGKWYYMTGSKKQTGWARIGGIWYYFDDAGVMKTGWQLIKGHYYYFVSSGAVKHGWLKYRNKWYYLTASGIMKTGWLNLKGKWYYFNKNGDMRTGWLRSGGNWYYLDSNGLMATGRVGIGGRIYEFDNSGKCLDP